MNADRYERLRDLREKLDAAEDEFSRATFIDSFARMQQVRAAASARVAAVKKEIAALEAEIDAGEGK